MSDLFVGVMSGTSRDGIDSVLMELDDGSCALRRATTTAFPGDISQALDELVRSQRAALRELGAIHTRFGEFAADCVLALLRDAEVRADEIAAIGFSGHTIFHQPVPPLAFTMQLGNPNVLAARTGITTVADIYDALTTDRPYRDRFSREKAFEILNEMKGKIDPDIVDLFI